MFAPSKKVGTVGNASLLLFLLIAGAGCGGVLQSGDDAGTSDASSSDAADVATFDALPASCASNDIYMLTWASNLYSFDPAQLAFKKIGNVSCFPTSFEPQNMAVNRQGTAFIQALSVIQPLTWSLEAVSTVDATCGGSVTVAGSPMFATNGGGMTFVRDTPGGSTETLYAVTQTGSSFGLAKVNEFNGSTTTVGELSAGPGSGMTLTGTSDARLFSAESPASSFDAGTTNIIFAQRDPSTADVMSSANISIPGGHLVVGMVFWGGDVWFFLRPDGAPGWMVGRYRTSDQSFTIVVNDIAAATGEQGLGITGVSSATCASN